jgi:hypothetical protein
MTKKYIFFEMLRKLFDGNMTVTNYTKLDQSGKSEIIKITMMTD